MAVDLSVNIGANVDDAVQGLGFVAERTKQLQTQIEYLRSKLADTKSEKFYANALGIIATKQAELNKISRATGDVLGKTVNNTQKATQSLTDLSRIAQDAPYGFNAIANNLNPLVESFGRLRTSTGSTGGALKALAAGLTGPAGIGLAIGVASSLLVKFGDDLFGAGKAAEKAKSDSDKLKDSINGIFGEVAKEATQVTSFVAVLKSETETRQRKLQAIKELQQIQPAIFSGLKLEGDQVVGLTSSYNAYVESLKTVVAAKIKQAQLDQVIEKLLKAQGVTLTDQEQAIVNFGDAIAKTRSEQLAGSVEGARFAEQQKKKTQAQTDEVKKLNAEVERLTKDLSQLSKGVKLDEIKAPKIKKVKQDKPLDLVFQPIIPKLDKELRNPVLEALKRDQKDILTEGEQIGKLINDSIAKNIKPLPKIVSPEVSKQLAEQQKALESQLAFAQQAASQISDAFSQAFDDILAGQNVFKAVGEAVKGLVIDIAKAAIRALIFRAILNAIVPGGAKALDLGGVSNLLPGRANGGPVSGKSPYIIGERGPELFVPSVSGSVIPNNRLSSFMGRPAFASGSGGGRTIVRGNDILLASARTQRSQNRVNA